MTDRNDNVWWRLGAAVLAILTLAAVIFGVLNLQQRLQFDVAIPVQTAGRRNPVVQAAIQARVDREKRSDANPAGGAFAIETIQFEVGAVSEMENS